MTPYTCIARSAEPCGSAGRRQGIDIVDLRAAGLASTLHRRVGGAAGPAWGTGNTAVTAALQSSSTRSAYAPYRAYSPTEVAEKVGPTPRLMAGRPPTHSATPTW